MSCLRPPLAGEPSAPAAADEAGAPGQAQLCLMAPPTKSMPPAPSPSLSAATDSVDPPASVTAAPAPTSTMDPRPFVGLQAPPALFGGPRPKPWTVFSSEPYGSAQAGAASSSAARAPLDRSRSPSAASMGFFEFVPSSDSGSELPTHVWGQVEDEADVGEQRSEGHGANKIGGPKGGAGAK